MGKGWSLFFGAVLGAIFVLCVTAPLVHWWLPEQVSTFGGAVDELFYVILFFTGCFFLLTEAVLVYAMYRFVGPNRRARHLHGDLRLELIWTLVPSFILVYIAYVQVQTWETMKYQARMPEPDVVLQVTARQWEWRVRTPMSLVLPGDEPGRRRWAESADADDVRLPNEVHTWKDAHVKVYLKTQDLIHSFFLPNLRLKQDALPGKTIPVWFAAKESNVSFAADYDQATDRWRAPAAADKDWELACAELCGGGHYRMRGRLYVHPDRADFRRWLDHVRARQQAHESTPAAVPVADNH